MFELRIVFSKAHAHGGSILWLLPTAQTCDMCFCNLMFEILVFLSDACFLSSDAPTVKFSINEPKLKELYTQYHRTQSNLIPSFENYVLKSSDL